MTGMSVVAAAGAKTGLPTPTRREYIPVGSIQASMPSTVGLEQTDCSRPYRLFIPTFVNRL